MNDDVIKNNNKIKHSFFLNIELAYIEAEKKNIVIDTDGNEVLQYCYYDGPSTDISLPNFLNVEQSNFVEFFSNNTLPIPTLIVHPDGNILDLKVNSPDIIEEIETYRKNHVATEHNFTF